MIGPKPHSNGGGVATVEKGEIVWPSQISKWQYWAGGEWHYDPELTITGKIEREEGFIFLKLSASDIQITCYIHS